MNFRTLDLNLLRVFDIVMLERNVTRAAARLAMTQPAVSNALRRLRESTHEELFVPTSTGVRPTAHAEALWPTVRTALDSLRAALEPQAFDPRTDARNFTLAMADATAALFVPVLVDLLQRESALVDLRILPLTTRDPRPMLETGQADAAIGFFPDVASALDADGSSSVLRRRALYRCGYVCAMRHDHPLAAKETLTLDDYCAAQHVRVSFAGRQRGYVDAALLALQRERRVMVTVNQFFSAAAAVHQSQLLTVLPRTFIEATGFAPELAVRALPFELPPIDVMLLWHGRHDADPSRRWLSDLLVRAATEIEARHNPASPSAACAATLPAVPRAASPDAAPALAAAS
ncbi:LysR family transcriptional regulator [Schlegelella sp. ID0723]|uniref:LysR family transcriptional regulator n=1 Tax=Piscinibacter koreensis TaxID=2742824 RepID=A0A7Y6NMQ3_9BURK|nr:LysR family transcriptional regulator [Schlegelella koreensis]